MIHICSYYASFLMVELLFRTVQCLDWTIIGGRVARRLTMD